MKPIQNLTRMAAALGIAISSLHAAPVIHEPFAQDPGALNGKATGTGLTGNWSANGNWQVDSGTMLFGSLASTGNKLLATTGGSGGRAFASTGTSLSDANLLNDGASLWFSVIYTTTPVVSGNPDAGFALGTAALNGTNNVPMGTGNSGIGFSVKNGRLVATTWINGTATRTINATFGPTVTGSTTYLVVGEIIWGADGVSNDTINLYFPDANLNLGTVVGTASAVLDQSAFTTLSYAHKNDSTPALVDEIRFAATAADVLPGEGDVTAPSLASTNPVNLATGNAYILTATFDELVAPGTGNIRIYNVNDMVTPYTTIDATDTTQVSADANDFLIKPNLVLLPGETYYVEIDAGVVRDGMGNGYAGFTGDATWKFTQESTSPTLADADIVHQINGGGSVFIEDIAFDYVVTFSEPMDPSTVDVGDFDNADATSITINSISPGAPSFAMGNATDTFTVSVTANDPGTVTLRVPSGATLNDSVGNAMTSLPVVDVETITIVANPGFVTISGTANGPGGSDDNWNNPNNWSPTVLPFGTLGAVIDEGVFAQVDDSAGRAQPYSGGLTFEANAKLQIGWTTNYATNINALGTGTITMKNGSELLSRVGLGTYTFPALALPSGSATIWAGVSTSNHNTTKTFGGGVSGAGKLIYNGVNNTWFRFNTNNNPGWTGGIETADPQNQGHQLGADANGCFGSGDVTINKNCNLVIKSGLTDTIDDGATLFVNGTYTTRGTNKLILNSSETVNEFWLDGVQIAAGDYTSASGLISSDGNNLIGGSGTLTVLNGPTASSPYDTWADGTFANGTLTDKTPTGDFDSDGLSNLLEFAFGTDPTVSDAGSLTWDGTNFTPGSPVVHVDYPLGGGVDFTARFIRRTDHGTAGSAAYAWQFSSDLADWEASDDAPAPGWFIAPTVLATQGDYQLVEVPYPLFLDNGKKARFFRTEVSLVP